MRGTRLLKQTAWVFGGGATMLAAGMCAWFYLGHPTVTPPSDAKAPQDAASLARGRYLAHGPLGCATCHSPLVPFKPGQWPDPDQLGAGRAHPTAGGGHPNPVIAPNISAHLDAGVGAWTDGEILRAFAEGIAADDSIVYPLCPYTGVRQLPESDVWSLVAWVRSLPAQETVHESTAVPFPTSMFVRSAPEPIATEDRMTEWPDNPLERGQLLMGFMGCRGCHTADFERPFGGGVRIDGPFGTVYSTNISSHRTDGIGRLTDEELDELLRTGRGKDGRVLWGKDWSRTAALDPLDRAALIRALRAVDSIVGEVPARRIDPRFAEGAL